MIDQKNIVLIVQIIVAIGALNWGLVAFNGTDLVKALVGAGDVDRYIKIAVGLAGAYAIFLLAQPLLK
jgi:uncharacterized membrane protein YuzA (DUF378 family)